VLKVPLNTNQPTEKNPYDHITHSANCRWLSCTSPVYFVFARSDQRRLSVAAEIISPLSILSLVSGATNESRASPMTTGCGRCAALRDKTLLILQLTREPRNSHHSLPVLSCARGTESDAKSGSQLEVYVQPISEHVQRKKKQSKKIVQNVFQILTFSFLLFLSLSVSKTTGTEVLTKKRSVRRKHRAGGANFFSPHRRPSSRGRGTVKI